MKKNWKLYSAIAAAVLLLAAGFTVFRSKSTAEPVETVAAVKGTLRLTVQATATVTPENKLEIMPPMAGRVETVEAEMGQTVKQGQVLAWMSSTERAALLDAARSKGEKEVAFWKDVYKASPIAAPLDGTIISRNVVPGQVVQTTTNVFVLSDRLIIEADLDETDLGKIVMDQSADVTLDGFPNEAMLHGRVHKIAYSSTTVNNVTTYKVDVLLDKIPYYMRSGMTANVSFLVSEHKDVVLIPAAALRGESTVFVLPDESKTPVERRIKTGLNDGKQIEVVSGLAEGEQVVSNAYKVPQASENKGFSLMPKMPKRNTARPPQ